MNRTRPIAIALAGLATCAVLWFILNHDWSRLRQWYKSTEFCLSRSYVQGVTMTARWLEDDAIRPKPNGTDVHIDFNSWGDPMRYQWENGRAILRAAGRDKRLNTKDDIVRVVKIKEETNHVEPAGALYVLPGAAKRN